MAGGVKGGGNPFNEALGLFGHSGVHTESAAPKGAVAGHTVVVADRAEPRAQSGGSGNALSAFFHKMSDFFQGLSESIRNAFTRSPAAEAPAAGSQQPADTRGVGVQGASVPSAAPRAAAGAPPLPECLHGQGALGGSDDIRALAFDVPLSKGDVWKERLTTVPNNQLQAAAFAFIYGSASTIAGGEGQLSAFERGTNIRSLTTQQLSKADEITTIADKIISKANGQIEPWASDSTKNYAKLDAINAALTEMLGDPDLPNSATGAAAKFPIELCNHLAVLHGAIDKAIADSVSPGTAVPPEKLELGRQMKLHTSRDVLNLRSIGPNLAVRPNIADRANIVISKSITSVVNGKGFDTDDQAPELKLSSRSMKDKWEPQFALFASAIVARADSQVIEQAATDGQAVAAAQKTVARERQQAAGVQN